MIKLGCVPATASKAWHDRAEVVIVILFGDTKFQLGSNLSFFHTEPWIARVTMVSVVRLIEFIKK